MRSRLAVLVVVAACRINDVDLPIGIIPKDLPADLVTDLDEAGRCWNLQFGTQFVTGPEAAAAEQQVEVFFDDSTCLAAAAQVQGSWPARLAICPQRYWPGIPDLAAVLDRVTPFRVVSHELGHVANIISHPTDPYAVMQDGGDLFDDMFEPVDEVLFADANPDFVTTTRCEHVVRSMLPGTTNVHCACDNGPLDIARSIAVVPSQLLSPAFRALTGVAARCFALRYGVAIDVHDPAPGEQTLYVEPCPSGVFGRQRANDVDSSLGCVTHQGSELQSAMIGIEVALGVAGPFQDTHPEIIPPFLDAQVLGQYPAAAIHCIELARDDTTGECVCQDP